MILENGATYRFLSREAENDAGTNGKGRSLNVYGTQPTSLANVCLYTSDDNDICQQWVYVEENRKKYLKCKGNTDLALDLYTGASSVVGVRNCNAHAFKPSETSCIEVEDAGGGYIYIRLSDFDHRNKYLAANAGANGTNSGKSFNGNGNVYFIEFNEGDPMPAWKPILLAAPPDPKPPVGPEPGEFSKNYLIYPVKNMKITQPYNSNGNHQGNFSGTPNDYPIDEACEDYKKSPFYCPCDEMVVVRTRVEEGATRGIWLESTSPVVTPSGTYPVITLMILHPDNAEVEKLEGRTFSRGEIICHEGKEGNATGNHFHISVGTDKYNGGKYKNGWQDNSEGEWVLTPLGKTLKPEEAFYVDPTFTNIIDSNGIHFSTVPSAN